MSYGDIRVVPLNSEKYLSFQVGNLRFIDSFQFLSTSLDNLVSLLLKSGRDMYLMVENNMRGGIATISQRYARANNPLVEGYDPSKPNSWITYLSANNLYGTAMSEPLPKGNFRFLSQDEILRL